MRNPAGVAALAGLFLCKKSDPTMVRIVERRGGVCIMAILYSAQGLLYTKFL